MFYFIDKVYLYDALERYGSLVPDLESVLLYAYQMTLNLPACRIYILQL